MFGKSPVLNTSNQGKDNTSSDQEWWNKVGGEVYAKSAGATTTNQSQTSIAKSFAAEQAYQESCKGGSKHTDTYSQGKWHSESAKAKPDGPADAKGEHGKEGDPCPVHSWGWAG